jgi:hypothetical protein
VQAPGALRGKREVGMGCGTNIGALAVFIMVALAATACSQSPVASAAAPARAEQARVPDEYLVTLAPEVDERVITEFYGSLGIREIDALGGETFLLVVTDDPGPQRMESLIRDDARFRAVRPNIIHWADRSGRKVR